MATSIWATHPYLTALSSSLLVFLPRRPAQRHRTLPRRRHVRQRPCAAPQSTPNSRIVARYSKRGLRRSSREVTYPALGRGRGYPHAMADQRQRCISGEELPSTEWSPPSAKVTGSHRKTKRSSLPRSWRPIVDAREVPWWRPPRVHSVHPFFYAPTTVNTRAWLLVCWARRTQVSAFIVQGWREPTIAEFEAPPGVGGVQLRRDQEDSPDRMAPQSLSVRECRVR
jgi:hypothetical protein